MGVGLGARYMVPYPWSQKTLNGTQWSAPLPEPHPCQRNYLVVSPSSLLLAQPPPASASTGPFD